MRFLGSFLFAAGAALGLLAACSSSSSSDNGCSSNPFQCAAGTVCAAKDTSGVYACLKSGSGTKGSTCQNTPGSTTCGDGLTCLQQSAAGGQCLPFCDPNGSHGCESGEQCRGVIVAGTATTFYICYGGTTPPAPPDGGTGDAATD